MLCVFLNGMCPSYFFKIFIFIFSPRRSRRGTLGISSPGGPVEEPLKPFCSFFSLRRLSSSVVFQWGSLRQTLDLSKTTNEKVPWRRPSNYIKREKAGSFRKTSAIFETLEISRYIMVYIPLYTWIYYIYVYY